MKIIKINRCKCEKKNGFSLIELIIVVALIGILSSIAFPSYTLYVKRQRIRAAQADLMALVLAMENYYALSSDNSYPVTTTSTEQTRQKLDDRWLPTESAIFKYEIIESRANYYKLHATGSTTRFNGCVISIDSSNIRSQSTACDFGTDWL
jgi:type IV pilus assembly protein PilE